LYNTIYIIYKNNVLTILWFRSSLTNEDIMVWSNRTLQEHNTGVNQLQIECQGVFHQHLNNLQGALNENIRREGLLPEACQVSRTLQGF